MTSQLSSPSVSQVEVSLPPLASPSCLPHPCSKGTPAPSTVPEPTVLHTGHPGEFGSVSPRAADGSERGHTQWPAGGAPDKSNLRGHNATFLHTGQKVTSDPVMWLSRHSPSLPCLVLNRLAHEKGPDTHVPNQPSNRSALPSSARARRRVSVQTQGTVGQMWRDPQGDGSPRQSDPDAHPALRLHLPPPGPKPASRFPGPQVAAVVSC